MGGNAFENTSRIEGQERLLSLFEEQKAILPKASPYMRVPRFLKDKNSFGDLDIVLPDKYLLYCYKEIFGKYDTNINEKFYTLSDQSFSYLYNNHQVDLIFVPESSLDFAYNYHSFGLQGSLLGIIFKNSDLTLRTTDLVKKNFFNNYSGVIQLETNYYSVLDSLGLDLEKFLNGFEDLPDLLYWLYESPYFNSEYFKLDSLNHKKRSRFIKNKDSAEILRIFEELPYKHSEHLLKKEFYEGYFLNRLSAYKSYNNYLDLKNAVDGRYIREILEVAPSDMSMFKNLFLNKYPRDYLVSQSKEAVETLLKNFYENNWK